MTTKMHKILTLLNKADKGLVFEELNKVSYLRNEEELNDILSDIMEKHWIYTVNDQDNRYKITGIGEDELRKENICRRSYIITICTFILSLVSLIVSTTALLLPFLS